MEDIKNKRESILQEAVAEYKKIVETADKNATERLRKELPEKFNAILKEEVNKAKGNESVKESKIIKEEDGKKESKKDIDKNTDNNKKESHKKEMNEEIDLRELSFEEIEEAYNEATTDDEFEVEGSSDEVSLDAIADELDSMEQSANDIEEAESDPYAEKLQQVHNMIGEMMKTHQNNENVHNESPEMVEDSGADNQEDSLIKEDTLDPQLMSVIATAVMAGAGAAPFIKRLMGSNPNIVKKLKSVIDSAMGSNAGAENNNVGEAEIKGDEDDEVVDEAHGQSYSAGKVSAGRLPNDGAEYRDRAGHSRNRPQWSNESIEKFKKQKENFEKRMNALISENKKLNKKLVENKDNSKIVDETSKELKVVKEHLAKYRNQLTEMAKFNANLAHANNILVNENITLTHEDKKNIISLFKEAKSVEDSRNIYESVLKQYGKGAKKINENVEEKINDSVESSSKNNINEAVSEKTAYQNNEHINKIKNLIGYKRVAK